jgi:glycosyltransferase involved in cell wall biosynthesis
MRISILSAVFNEEDHLEEMVSSVQSQDHEDWELILVDDGSSDATLSIAKDLAERDPRVRVLGGEKMGKVAAYNLAFANSTGHAVALLGGDDTLPAGSLSARAKALSGHLDGPTVAYFKLYMFSDDPKFDGVVLPRGRRGSRSGGSLTMSRTLASMVFPIPESLPSEDIWLGAATEDLATEIVECSEVVLNYRVHAGNSNPRGRSFDEMTKSLAARHRAWSLLLESETMSLSPGRRETLGLMWQAERHRQRGEVAAIMRIRGLPLADRLAMSAAARPTLFRLRTRFYKLLSGRRGA